MTRSPGLDYDAAFAVLEAREREVMAGLVDTLGLEPDDWLAVPGLRCVVLAVAALRLTADVHANLAPTAKLREACTALGCGPRSGVVGASIARNLRRWQAARR